MNETTTGSTIQDRPKQTTDESPLRKQAAQAGDKVLSNARKSWDKGREEAEKRVNEQKAAAANRVRVIEDAARSAAHSLKDKDEAAIGEWTERFADIVSDAAGYLENRTIPEVTRDVQSAVRRNPGMCFGGLFIAGLAAARFLKASQRNQEIDYSESAYPIQRFPQEGAAYGTPDQPRAEPSYGYHPVTPADDETIPKPEGPGHPAQMGLEEVDEPGADPQIPPYPGSGGIDRSGAW